MEKGKSLYTYFGRNDPSEMPGRLFSRCIGWDLASAKRAIIDRQNYSVCPRHWYIDVTIKCLDCLNVFIFTAGEQRAWYEDYYLWIDVTPSRCQACRKRIRRRNVLRTQYSKEITSTLADKNRDKDLQMLSLIDEICELEAKPPRRLLENIRRLTNRLKKYK